MNRNVPLTILSCILVMLAALTLFVNKVVTPTDLTKEQLNDLGAYLIDPPRELGSFVLMDTNEKQFLPLDFNGKWNIIFFGFSFCPDICPITMNLLARIEGALDERELKKARFFMVTVDPDRDSPKKLKEYLNNFSDSFIGLTGSLDQIYNFATKVNAPFNPISNNNDPYYTVDHTGSIVLIDPNGNYAGFFRAPHNEDDIKEALFDLLTRSY